MTTRQESRFKWLDRVLAGLFVLSLGVASFIGGAYVTEFDVAFYRKTLKPSFQGLRALESQKEFDRARHGWTVARNGDTGVTIHQTGSTYDGWTLLTDFAESCTARLIAMDGSVVHRWRLPFREVWPDADHVSTPVPDSRIHWWRARPLPNGDLIVNYSGIAGSPNGYGLVKIDKDSRLLWQFPDATHHDFDVDEKGQVFTLVHSITKSAIEAAPHLRTPMLADEVVVLSPEGEEVRRVSILRAFARSRFRGYLDAMRSNAKGDHTHANAIDVISASFAEKHRFCSAGDVMISLRNPSLLVIVNLEEEKIVWAATGTWHRQHDSDPLANGNIMLFDNLGNQRGGGVSRVLEWNPASGAIEWSYGGTEAAPLESRTRSCQQLLPNGNVLITESDHGRILEITREGSIVWEYRNPSRDGENDELVAVVFNAERYAHGELPFLDPQSHAAGLAEKDAGRPSMGDRSSAREGAQARRK